MEPTYSAVGKAVSWAILLPLGLIGCALCLWLLYLVTVYWLNSSEWYRYFVRGMYMPTEYLRSRYIHDYNNAQRAYWLLLYRLRNINHIRKMHRK